LNEVVTFALLWRTAALVVLGIDNSFADFARLSETELPTPA
jgi:hypothetical protein